MMMKVVPEKLAKVLKRLRLLMTLEVRREMKRRRRM
jgi:hypothetical protein